MLDLSKERRITASPAVDRLLHVADYKKRSIPALRACQAVGEGLQDLPLGWAGVLELVEEHVVGLRVKPMAHARQGAVEDCG